MALHTYGSSLVEKAKQNPRNAYHLGIIELGALRYNSYIITSRSDVNNELVLELLDEIKIKVLKSIRSSKWYDYFDDDEGLILIEWGNRGLTIFFYNACYYGPSLEIVARSYYYRWSEKIWKPETRTDPFVSIFGVGILSEFINSIKSRCFQQ